MLNCSTSQVPVAWCRKKFHISLSSFVSWELVSQAFQNSNLCPKTSALSQTEVPRIAIVGGGPGGLMTAYFLQKKLSRPIEITVFEASTRLGGKIQTLRFDSAPVFYEAGAAEFYDYSPIDEDALKDLIAEFGLLTVPMGGNSVVLKNQFLGTLDDVETALGHTARREIEQFYWQSRNAISHFEFYDSQGEECPPLVSPDIRFDVILNHFSQPTARHFVETLIHSDLAAEPQDTNATYGLHNYLMNDCSFMQLYGIVGGNQQLVECLAGSLNVRYKLGCPVTSLQRKSQGCLVVEYSSNLDTDNSGTHQAPFDCVVLALPLYALKRVQFGGTALQSAMLAHQTHFDHPAHYLRISVLFEHPFWQGLLADSFCMLDQFDGCCLYDESSRSVQPKWGVLGWLISGKAAQQMSALSDEELIEKALDSLPSELQHGRSVFVEGKVHRWLAAVNAMPGGESIMPVDRRHQPEPQYHTNLFVVGDYLFDSTINGVLDSADYVSDWISAQLNN